MSSQSADQHQDDVESLRIAFESLFKRLEKLQPEQPVKPIEPNNLTNEDEDVDVDLETMDNSDDNMIDTTPQVVAVQHDRKCGTCTNCRITSVFYKNITEKMKTIIADDRYALTTHVCKNLPVEKANEISLLTYQSLFTWLQTFQTINK